jgi:hypothetical protein
VPHPEIMENITKQFVSWHQIFLFASLTILLFLWKKLWSKKAQAFKGEVNKISGPPTIPFLGNALSLLVPDYGKIFLVVQSYASIMLQSNVLYAFPLCFCN